MIRDIYANVNRRCFGGDIQHMNSQLLFRVPFHNKKSWSLSTKAPCNTAHLCEAKHEGCTLCNANVTGKAGTSSLKKRPQKSVCSANPNVTA